MSVTAERRAAVRVAYDYRCGYCHVPESDIGGQLQIDHYRPLSKGGSDDVDNLVYACSHCNSFKGGYWPEEGMPDSFYLLHPDEDDSAGHIEVAANGRLMGLTPRGWFHIHWLRLNRPQLIVWRQKQRYIAELQAALNQTEMTTGYLQERIRVLEKEVTELRVELARLSKR